MTKTFHLAVASAAMMAMTSLATAPSAEAHRYSHKHRWGGVSIMIGAPMVYGGYGYYGYRPSYAYRSYDAYEPRCYRWGWVHSRSGKAKWRCMDW